MVCLGNICRSPTAEVVFRKMVIDQNLHEFFEIDSAGTGDWHVGHSPDSRATSAAAKRDMDLSTLKARLVEPDDFDYFDYIFAMDKENYKNLCLMSPSAEQDKISLFLCQGSENSTNNYEDVPDPYYSGDDGFELVLDLIEEASTNIIATLVTKHKLSNK